jgi:hypothetical protein
LEDLDDRRFKVGQKDPLMIGSDTEYNVHDDNHKIIDLDDKVIDLITLVNEKKAVKEESHSNESESSEIIEVEDSEIYSHE